MITLKRGFPEEIWKWRHDPRIHKWLRQNEMVTKMYQSGFEINADHDQTKQFFIVSDGEQEVGCAGLTSIDWNHRTAEFSLLIDPDKQRNGYGKEALIKLISYGFINLDLQTIWGETFDGNPALKMFLNIGFTQDGYLRSRFWKEGKRIGATAVSITQKEFREKYL